MTAVPAAALSHAAIDITPVVRMALAGAVIALLPLAWTWHRRRRAMRGRSAGVASPVSPASTSWLHALTLTTVILTFDLVLFGSFTRLTDSGLGCPDWPGCYGHATPLGAKPSIDAAVAQQPDGPVTHAKAWIEMIHRYFAMTVGVLILVMAVEAWRLRLRGARSSTGGAPGVAPLWPTVTLVWVIMQGAFGAWTVTMRLYPAVVTAHLMLGLGLLALLAVQAERVRGESLDAPPGVHRAAWVLAVLLGVQVALGGWVSTNYAVLACADFPRCQGAWWPPMDFAEGFTLRRELGRSGGADAYLPFPALTAIHVAHRLAAVVLLLALAGVAWLLWRNGSTQARRFAAWLAGLGTWQLLTGMSNVVLGWPLVAALAHVAGAAGLAVVLATLLVRLRPEGAGRTAGISRLRGVAPEGTPAEPLTAPTSRL
jgi:cytochrome c oxidase assembly protein subunit 15